MRQQERERLSDSSYSNTQQVSSYNYIWFWKAKFPERKGQRCRVVKRGGMNSILVEFEDGFQTLTSRNAVRQAPLDEV